MIDQEKTSFITEQDTYCYNVLSFGLKNTRATYNTFVNKVFKQDIGKTTKVYVDYMLIKTITVEQHAKDLEKTFATLRADKMMLNLTKYTFGVEAEKFLGFMVSQRVIEANPEKIKADLEMSPLKNTKEIQRLTGRVAALNRIISKATERYLTFFDVLKKSSKFTWTMEC